MNKVSWIEFFKITLYCLVFTLFHSAFAAKPLNPQSDSCVKAVSLTPPSGAWYWSVDVYVKNSCTHEVDLRDAHYSIETPFLPTEARISFENSGMSWVQTKVMKQTKGAEVPNYPSLNLYTSSLALNYSSDPWIVTKIKPNGQLRISLAASLSQAMEFSQELADLILKSTVVTLASEPNPEPGTEGSIAIKLGSAPVTKTDFPKHAQFNIQYPDNQSQIISLDWNSEYVLKDLQLGSYVVKASAIEYNSNLYQAKLPDTVNLTKQSPANQLQAEYVQQGIDSGTINLKLGKSPAQGLPSPVVIVNDATDNSKLELNKPWESSHLVENAPANHQYKIESQAIDGYKRTAQPSSFILQKNTTANVAIDYTLIPATETGQLSLAVTGVPDNKLVSIVFQNNSDGKQTSFSIANENKEVTLNQGIYTIEAQPVDYYFAKMVTGTNPVTITGDVAPKISFEYSLQSPSSTNKHIIGYFTAWGIYGRDYQVTDIPASKLTDINYAFVNIANGECVLGDPWADIDMHYPEVTTSLGVFPADSWTSPQSSYFGNFNRLNRMKELAEQQGHHVNLFLSVGGWTWSKYFSDVAASSAAREKFVNSCVALMNHYQFDGIDLDWEYPVGGGLPYNHYRPEDKVNYTLLLKLFREKMGVEKLLTIAAPAGPHTLPNIEWDKIGQYINWTNLMAYDFHGGWDNITGHNAPLYSNPEDPAPATLNADTAVSRIVELGFPANKIVLGVGFYGRGWENVSAQNNGLFQSGTGTTKGTWEAGVFDYHDLVANYHPKYQHYFDSYTKVPYLYNLTDKIFISYENPNSMTIKANYILNHNLAGVMFWELSGDIRDSSSADSLLGTLHQALK